MSKHFKYSPVNVCKVVLHNCKYKIYVHAVNKNRGAEVVAPVDVLGVGSSITLACKLS